MNKKTDPSAVLYLSYDGMTDPLGQSQVIPYLQGLAQRGYRIWLVSFEKPELVDKQPFISQKLAESGIQWVPMRYTKKPPVLSTLYDLWQLRLTAFRLHQQHGFSIVHTRSYLTALVGRAMQDRFGVRFVFDMRGFFPDERVDGGIWRLDSPIYQRIYRFFKQKEIEFFSRANHSICLTHEGRRIIHSWPQVAAQPVPIAVIPCCTDTALFDPARVTPEALAQWRQRLRIPEGAFVLGYLGSVGTWYMLPEMLAFFAELLKTKPEAIFLFVSGEHPDTIGEEADRQGVPRDRLRVIGVSREQVPEVISLAHAAIFFIKPVFSKKASSPTKQGELMALGIPLICNAGVGDTDWIVEKYQSGLLVHHLDSTGYQVAIGQLDQLLALDRERIIQGADDYFSLEKGIATYEAVYRAVRGDL